MMRWATFIGVVLFFVITGIGWSSAEPTPFMSYRFIPRPPEKLLTYSIWRTAPIDVAKVFGRVPACSSADDSLVDMTAKAAIEANLDPTIAAATVATESGCNPWAVSSRGAVGMMQVMPKIWSDRFDFAGSVNLFNPEDNIRTGSKILASLVQQYGTSEALRRYNGLGVGCDTCDAGYVNHILSLAGR